MQLQEVTRAFTIDAGANNWRGAPRSDASFYDRRECEELARGNRCQLQELTRAPTIAASANTGAEQPTPAPRTGASSNDRRELQEPARAPTIANNGRGGTSFFRARFARVKCPQQTPNNLSSRGTPIISFCDTRSPTRKLRRFDLATDVNVVILYLNGDPSEACAFNPYP
jgi:hypothetical protein